MDIYTAMYAAPIEIAPDIETLNEVINTLTAWAEYENHVYSKTRLDATMNQRDNYLALIEKLRSGSRRKLPVQYYAI